MKSVKELREGTDAILKVDKAMRTQCGSKPLKTIYRVTP